MGTGGAQVRRPNPAEREGGLRQGAWGSGGLGGRPRVRAQTHALQGLALQIRALPAAAVAGAAGWGAAGEPQALELS